MKRAVAIAASIALGVAAAGSAVAQDRPCESRTVRACYAVHGSLLTANGTPAFRIMVGDARRVLGIAGGEEPPLPDAVRKALAPDMFSNTLSGDYIVCPQTEEHQGQMQMVCVKSGSNLKLEPR